MKKFDEYGVQTALPRSWLPRGATVLRPVVVFTHKLANALTGLRKFKCRVTVDGSTITQPETATNNTDFNEIRLLFTLASTFKNFKGDVCTADAEQGYLQALIRGKDIYMLPPQMHEDFKNGKVWKLNKNLYGLPNGAAVFEDKVHTVLRQCGWKRIPGLKHSWVKFNDKREVQGYLAVYVDDFLCIGINAKSSELMEEIGKLLKINIQNEEVKVRFIGNDLNKSSSNPHARRVFHQSQNHYVKSMNSSKSASFATPLPERVNEKSNFGEIINNPKRISEFRSKLGNLLFVSRDSRPDVAYAASYFGKQVFALTEKAFELMDRTTQYMKDNEYSIPVPSTFVSEKLDVKMYVDASMGNNNDVHGTTGWILLVNGYPISWRAKRQHRVSRSSLKAELIALHDAIDQIEWLSTVAASQGIDCDVNIFTDSKDLVHLVLARHPHPSERADIFRIEQIRQALGRVPLEALRDG